MKCLKINKKVLKRSDILYPKWWRNKLSKHRSNEYILEVLFIVDRIILHFKNFEFKRLQNYNLYILLAFNVYNYIDILAIKLLYSKNY